MPPAAPGPSGTSRLPVTDLVTTLGRSSTAVPVPPLAAVPADALAGAAAWLVRAAAVRPTLLRLPNTHSAMCARKASV